MRVLGIVFIWDKFPDLSVKLIKSTSRGSYPVCAGAIFKDTLHFIMTQTCWVSRIMLIRSKLICFLIVFIESSPSCADPKHFSTIGRILKYGSDEIIAYAMGISRIVHILFHRVTIMSIQSTFGAKPHNSLAVLNDATDATMGKAVLLGQMLDFVPITLGDDKYRQE
jgi:hypothetical protein